MKLSDFCYLLLFLLPVSALAQSPPQPAPMQNQVFVGPGVAGGRRVVIRTEMGKWWKDSNVAKKLQLSDGQMAQLDQTFFDHKMKLVDYNAQMEKEDLKLQNLLDQDVPDEGQVGTQVNHVLAARGRLEREYTMMSLDLRKVLSVEQWRQLKSIREQRSGHVENFFYKALPPGAPLPGPGAEIMQHPDAEPLAPLPPPMPED